MVLRDKPEEPWVGKVDGIVIIQEPRSVRKNLARLAVPIFIETLLIMMLGAVDTVMLSQYSDNSVAAVGVVNQLIMFAFLIFEDRSLHNKAFLHASLPTFPTIQEE